MSSTFKTHLEHFDISLQPSNSRVIPKRCYQNAHLFSRVIGRTRNGFLFPECLSRSLPHHIILSKLPLASMDPVYVQGEVSTHRSLPYPPDHLKCFCILNANCHTP